jgi:hypothetical protein
MLGQYAAVILCWTKTKFQAAAVVVVTPNALNPESFVKATVSVVMG